MPARENDAGVAADGLVTPAQAQDAPEASAEIAVGDATTVEPSPTDAPLASVDEKAQTTSVVRRERQRQGAVRVSAEFYLGPLPHPDLLSKYEQVKPGLTEEIIEGWKGERDHRRGIENRMVSMDEKLVDGEIWAAKAGVIVGGVVVLGALVAAVCLGAQGHPTAAAIVGSLDIAAIVAVFVYGTRRRSDSATRPNEQPRRSLAPPHNGQSTQGQLTGEIAEQEHEQEIEQRASSAPRRE